MDDLTEEEFNAIKGIKPIEDISEEEFNKIKSAGKKESGMGNYMKNVALGIPARFEEAAAGLSGPLAPKSWLDKIARQQEWVRQNPESGIGGMVADTAMSIPAMFAAPEVAGTGAISKLLSTLGKDTSLGAALGYATTPGGTEERNRAGATTGIGSLFGSVLGQTLKGVIKTGGDIARYLNPSEETQKHSVSNLIKQAIPEDAQSEVIHNLENVDSFIPGFKATAMQAGKNPGLNALGKFAEPVIPGHYGTRELENLAATHYYIKTISKDAQDLVVGEAAKKAVTKPLYDEAEKRQVQVTPALSKLFHQPNMGDAVDRGIIDLKNNGIDVPTDLKNTLLKGYREVNTGLLDSSGKPIVYKAPAYISGKHLDYINKAISARLEDVEKPLAKTERIGHIKTALKLDRWMQGAIPEYGQAKTMYREMSKPTNQMKIGEAIRKEGFPAINNSGDTVKMNPDALAEAIYNPKIVKKATGMSGNISKYLTPEQNQTLDNISKNLNRSELAKIGTGGDFNNVSQSFLARFPGAVIGNVTNTPGTYQLLAAKMYENLGKSKSGIKTKLAESLLDPEETLKFLKMGKQKEFASFMNGNKRNAIPGIMGYVAGQEINR